MTLAFLLYKYFPYGGMQRDFMRFLSACRERGHDTRVYYIEWQGERPDGVDLRQVPVAAASNHTRNERYYDWVRTDLEKAPVDGVVGFNKMPGLDVYYAADSCYLDKAYRERSWLYRLGPRFRHFSRYEAAVFGSDSDTRILLISETERNKFEHYYATPAARMRMLPPGIDADRRAGADAAGRRASKRVELALGEDEPALLFVGSGFIKKGLDRAIRALAAASQEAHVSGLQLFVVGQDTERRFRQLAKRLGVADSVHFLGGRDDIPDLLLAADLLVHPALDEAAGIVLLEALVAGLPALVTDVCGYAHHIAASGAGSVLASPFRQQDLDAAVLAGLDASYRERCRTAGLAYAEHEDLYSMHETGAGWIEEWVAEKRAGLAHAGNGFHGQ
ncbi:MAG: glycosyltransferase family 4 protein [Pseudomonadota bacterium]